MGIHVNIGEAKSRLSELVAAAMRGEEVVLAKAGDPQVKLVPIQPIDEGQLRAEKMKAWIGSFAGMFPPGAGDLFLEPTFSDEELDSFSSNF